MKGKTGRKRNPLPTSAIVLCVVVALALFLTGTYYATNVRGKDGKDGLSAFADDLYTVKAETVHEYVTEYLSSPDGTQQIKELTREDINSYADTISEYFTANGVQPTSNLTTIENELLEKLTEELMQKLDMDEIRKMIDLAVAAYLKDLKLSGADPATDYSALIAELRSKYDAKIDELTSMINDLQGNYNDITNYIKNTTVSVTDVKVLEETIAQLRAAIEQLNTESNSLTLITNKFEQDFSILDQRVTENFNSLNNQISQTNVAIEEMHQSLLQDITNLTEVFGQDLTEVYDTLDQYINIQAQLSEQRDLQLQQNLDQFSADITDEMNNNIIQLTQELEQTAQDIRYQLDTQITNLDSKLEQTANDIRIELQNNVDILNAKLSEEVLNLNTRITTEVNDINTRLEELKTYVDEVVNSEIERLTGELNKERSDREAAVTALSNELEQERKDRKAGDDNMYNTVANQYEWSKDAYNQDKLTVTTPAKR